MLSPEEQTEKICELANKEIERLNGLSPDEAKKEALASLRKIGILDGNGEFTEPYKTLGQYIEEASLGKDPVARVK